MDYHLCLEATLPLKAIKVPLRILGMGERDPGFAPRNFAHCFEPFPKDYWDRIPDPISPFLQGDEFKQLTELHVTIQRMLGLNFESTAHQHENQQEALS